MVGDDYFCRSVQLPRTAIVAEPLPESEHIVLGRRGQGRHGGKPLQKATIKIDDPLHLRLLEHDLAHPHAIRILRPAPGQIPPRAAIPGQECPDHCGLPCLLHKSPLQTGVF